MTRSSEFPNFQDFDQVGEQHETTHVSPTLSTIPRKKKNVLQEICSLASPLPTPAVRPFWLWSHPIECAARPGDDQIARQQIEWDSSLVHPNSQPPCLGLWQLRFRKFQKNPWLKLPSWHRTPPCHWNVAGSSPTSPAKTLRPSFGAKDQLIHPYLVGWKTSTSFEFMNLLELQLVPSASWSACRSHPGSFGPCRL